jgi:hypothetical protein
MPSNVNYAINDAQINALDEAITKATEIEEYMLDTNVDHDIICGKVQI